METPTLRLLPRSLALVAALLALPLAAAAQPALDRPITFPAPDGRTPLNSLPVRLTVRLSGGAQPPTLRAWLNGRDVTRLFARAGAGACLVTACDLVAEVTPGDGLQPGLNELRVEARTGVPGVVANSLSFVLQVPLPAADAGADQKGALGQAVKLDGSGSRAAGPLTYRWALTRLPEGSAARLAEAETATPSFVPDVRGNYVAQLVVSDSNFDSTPDAVLVNVPLAETMTPLQARVCCGPNGTHGVRVGNDYYHYTGGDPRVKAAGLNAVAISRQDASLIAHQVFPTGDGTGFQPIKSFLEARGPGELVIISSTDSSGVHNQELAAALASFGASDGIAALPAGRPLSFIGYKGLKPGAAFHAAGEGGLNLTHHLTRGAAGYYTAVNPDFTPFLANDPAQPNSILVGATRYTPPALPDGASGGFALLVLDRDTLTPVALPGVQSAAKVYATNVADVNQGMGAAAALANDITMTIASKGNSAMFFVMSLGQPALIAPETAEFDVHNADIINTHHGSITITCQTSDPNDTTTVTTPVAVGTDKTDIKQVTCPADHPTYNRTWSFVGPGLKFTFRDVINPGDLRTTPLPAAIKQLGGTPYAVMALYYGDNYALIGSPDPKFTPMETGTVIKAGAGTTIRGVIGRDASGALFGVTAADTDPQLTIPYDIFTIPWEPATGFIAYTVAGEQAAYRYLSMLTDCPGTDPNGTNPCLDIRANKYQDLSVGAETWNNSANLIKTAAYPQGNTNFNEAQFAAVRDQLVLEYKLVAQVRGFYDAITMVNTQVKANVSDTLTGVKGEIATSAQTKTDPSDVIAVQVASAILQIFGILGDLVAPDLKVSSATGLFGGFMGAVTPLVTNSSGDPLEEVEGTVDQLADELSQAWPQVISGTEQMFKNILGDYGKLTKIGTHRCPQIATINPGDICSSDPGWDIENYTGTVVGNATIGQRRHFYARIMPVLYSVDTFPASNQTLPQPYGGSDCVAFVENNFPIYYNPYEKLDPQARYWIGLPTLSFPGVKSAQRQYQDFFVITRTEVGFRADYSFPPNDPKNFPTYFADRLFKSPADDSYALGFPRLQFLTNGPLKPRKWSCP